MQPLQWMIYGANGYTGKLIAEQAKADGLSPVLAGRDAGKIQPIAEALGLSWKAFGLSSADEAAAGIQDMQLVLHCAGPFAATSGPMVEACLRKGAHYLDITGEVDVFEAIFARDADAKQAGSVLMPGVGFDVVPTDCLAALLHKRLPDATELVLGIAGFGRSSPGTTKTVLEGVVKGGRVRRGGRIVVVPPAWKVKQIPFSDRERSCVTIPWGDVCTAYHSTGIADITVYMAFPEGMIRALRLSRPLIPIIAIPAVQNFLKRRIERRVKGPSEQERAAGRVHLWGEVRNIAGDQCAATLDVPEGYSFTIRSALECVRGVAAGGVPAGAVTPSRAFGGDFIHKMPDTQLSLLPEA